MSETNENLWRALGWERNGRCSTSVKVDLFCWERGERHMFPSQMPDYENDDAAAVALLEELRLRDKRIALLVSRGGYEIESAESLTEHSTFRAAVVAGALALLCGEES